MRRSTADDATAGGLRPRCRVRRPPRWPDGWREPARPRSVRWRVETTGKPRVPCRPNGPGRPVCQSVAARLAACLLGDGSLRSDLGGHVIEKAVILSTGDELTSGLTVDTNSNFLADKLFEIGVDLVAVITVGDDAERIRWAFASGLDQADLVIATGGLGPTADDLTTETLAATLGRGVYFDEESAEHIRALFRSISRTMPENNLRQANFPQGAVILANPLGTAPGYRVEVEWKERKRFVVVMPGVPREMKPMLENTVLPWIRSLDESGLVYRSRSFQTFGASESALDEMMAGAIMPEEGRLSFRAAFPQISVRVTAHGSPGEVDEKLARLGERVRARIGDYVFGEGAATMEGV